MWSRTEAALHAPHTDTWPSVAVEALIPADREKFEAQKKAIISYLAGEPVRYIQTRTGICRKLLPRLAKKCLLLASDGRIFGFRALIPYTRLAPYIRNAPCSYKRPQQQGGQTGALGAVLRRFSEIEDDLVKRIRQDAKLREIPEYRLRPRDLHKLFIRYLKEKEVSGNEWPFNTQYRGLRSIQRYMANILNKNFARSVNNREEKDAKAHTNVGTGHEPFLFYEEPYDAVEIDAYNIEAHLTVAFRTPEGTEAELLLERIWLLAAVDRASTAVLAHLFVYRSEVTADDVVQIIRDAATKKWVPKTITIPGLTYPEKGGLPSGVIPAALGAVWSVTMLDGALAHLAEKVRERTRKKVGFILNWGPPGHFERRPNVERTFRQVGQDLIRRLPSTTGSNPHSGRAPEAEEKAIRYKIRVAEIEELADIYMAQHNATPNEGISHLTPLEFIKYFLDGSAPRAHARQLPGSDLDKAKGFACVEVKTVRGSRKEGRRPYIQIDRVHYTSPVLADAAYLIGKRLMVEIDEEDMRQARAFLDNGAELGYVKAQGRWSLTKHSRRTRKAINSLLHKKILIVTEFDDPVHMYLAYLSSPVKRASQKKSALTPRQVTDATRVAKEAGVTPHVNAPMAHGFVTTPAPGVSEVATRKALLYPVESEPRKAKNRR